MRKNVSFWAAGALTSLAILGFACSEDPEPLDNHKVGAGGNGSGSNSGGSGPATTTDGVGGNFTTGVGGNGSGGSCLDDKYVAQKVIKPADIIMVIDNSGSMSEEINSVEQNINVNFAQILAASQVDYQVIMVTNHGTGSYDVCIGPPLSNSTNCSAAPGETAQFHHYDVDVQSWDSVCKALNTLYGPNGGGEADTWGLHPEGWSKWLRTEAVKIFVEVTDDRMSCTWNGNNFNDGNDTSGSSNGTAAQAAVLFDQVLLSQAPAQFGSVAARNYLFYSIVGVASKPNPLDAYQAAEPFVSTKCSSAVNVAPGYQWLSKGTGGLRFPVCNYQSYDAVFQSIAAGVVEGAAVPCEFEIPEPGGGQQLDLSTLLVEYTPGGTGSPEVFQSVPSAAACGLDDAAFYIEDDLIKLCPEACERVSGDNDADIAIIAQCGGIAQ